MAQAHEGVEKASLDASFRPNPDALTLYGESLGHLMYGQLHPGDEGCKELGHNFLNFASSLFFGGSDL